MASWQVCKKRSRHSINRATPVQKPYLLHVAPGTSKITSAFSPPLLPPRISADLDSTLSAYEGHTGAFPQAFFDISLTICSTLSSNGFAHIRPSTIAIWSSFRRGNLTLYESRLLDSLWSIGPPAPRIVECSVSKPLISAMFGVIAKAQTH